jgi:hypothetical protein
MNLTHENHLKAENNSRRKQINRSPSEKKSESEQKAFFAHEIKLVCQKSRVKHHLLRTQEKNENLNRVKRLLAFWPIKKKERKKKIISNKP